MRNCFDLSLLEESFSNDLANATNGAELVVVKRTVFIRLTSRGGGGTRKHNVKDFGLVESDNVLDIVAAVHK